MKQAELKAVFKVIKDSSVKKVIDDVKGEVRSLGTSMNISGDMFKGLKGKLAELAGFPDTLKKQIFKASPEIEKEWNAMLARMNAPKPINFKAYGAADLPKMFSKTGPALPPLPSFMSSPDFFKKSNDPKSNKVGMMRDIEHILTKFSGALGLSVGGLARLGLVGIGLAGSFTLLNRTIRETSQAYENARQLYAKSLMTGLGIGFVTKRGLIAETLGVSETEIFRFGSSLAYLAPKLSWAADALTKTTIPLTAVSYQIKIMEKNFSALFALIATEAAPTIFNLVEDINDMIKSMSDTDTIKQWVDTASKTAAVVVTIMAAIGTAIGSFVVGLQLIWDALQAVIGGIYNASLKLVSSGPFARLAKVSAELGALSGGASAGEANKAGEDAYSQQSGIFEKQKLDLMSLMKPGIDSATELNKFIEGMGKISETLWKGTDNKFKAGALPPPPQSQLKQLPVGAFEKMGLIIGGGMANKALEIQRRTAVATEKLVALATGKNHQKEGFYLNRNPQVAGY